MYQCLISLKCISMCRLMDTVYGCLYMDDENVAIINNTDLIERLYENYFRYHLSKKTIP